MALSLTERARVRHHLGYLNVSPGASISLGIPSASQPLFLVESSMNSLMPEAEPSVRRAIKELDCIEDQLNQKRSQLGVTSVEGIRFDIPSALDELESQYQLWSRILADTFGCPINPFSLKHQRFGAEMFVVEPL
jgi:hypothetical protein